MNPTKTYLKTIYFRNLLKLKKEIKLKENRLYTMNEKKFLKLNEMF
jgi:hypothetical protein